MSQETRDRVLDAIQKLDYRPNKHAQMLMQEKWDSVAADQLGVIISSVTMFKRPYYGEILAGLHEEAHRRNHHIRFIRLFEALRNPALLNQLVHKHEVSGLVLLALDQVLLLHDKPDNRLFRQIVELVARAICLEWHHEGLSSVSFDRHRAALEVTTHLLTSAIGFWLISVLKTSTLHQLRKAWTSHLARDLIAAGTYSPKLLARLMGHSSSEVTLEVYGLITGDDYYSPVLELDHGRVDMLLGMLDGYAQRERDGVFSLTPSLSFAPALVGVTRFELATT